MQETKFSYDVLTIKALDSHPRSYTLNERVGESEACIQLRNNFQNIKLISNSGSFEESNSLVEQTLILIENLQEADITDTKFTQLEKAKQYFKSKLLFLRVQIFIKKCLSEKVQQSVLEQADEPRNETYQNLKRELKQYNNLSPESLYWHLNGLSRLYLLAREYEKAEKFCTMSIVLSNRVSSKDYYLRFLIRRLKLKNVLENGDSENENFNSIINLCLKDLKTSISHSINITFKVKLLYKLINFFRDFQDSENVKNQLDNYEYLATLEATIHQVSQFDGRLLVHWLAYMSKIDQLANHSQKLNSTDLSTELTESPDYLHFTA